ncbi:hypothetical protein U1Q18_020609 [Sarracenia purpurea var. burkii]
MKMGSSFKKAIFDEHVQAGIVGWAQKVKRKKQLKTPTNGSGEGKPPTEGSAMGIQLGRVTRKESAEEILPTTGAQV